MEKGKLLIKDKEVVVPGEVLAQGMSYLPSQGTYRKGNDVIASKLGLARVEGNVVKIIPVSGRYLPKKGDVIIAKVTDINIAGWTVDTNSAYRAMQSM